MTLLGVNVDAADAMRRGISATDLRRSILDTLAARAEASNVIAVAPSTTATADSPIVRRARQRADQPHVRRVVERDHHHRVRRRIAGMHRGRHRGPAVQRAGAAGVRTTT